MLIICVKNTLFKIRNEGDKINYIILYDCREIEEKERRLKYHIIIHYFIGFNRLHTFFILLYIYSIQYDVVNTNCIIKYTFKIFKFLFLYRK